MNSSFPILPRFFAALPRHRLPIAVAVIVVIAGGFATLTRMPLQLLPEIRYPQIRVIGDFPGRTATVIEESVNQPLEEAFAGLEGLMRMESRSGDGRSYIELFFQPGHDLDRGLQDTLQGVSRARASIPPEFPDPRVFPVGTSEAPVMQIIFSSATLSPHDLRNRLRADVVPRLRNIRGVEAVFIGREDNRELIIELDRDKMDVVGINDTDVELLLLNALAPAVDGAIHTAEFEGVGTLAAIAWDEEQISGLPIASAAPGARPVPLSSIADVRRGVSDQSLRNRLNGENAVLLTIHRTPRANAVLMAKRVREVVERSLADPAMATARAEIIFDDSRVTAAAARNVGIAAAAGSVLAMALIILGLRRRRSVPVVACIVLAGLAASIVVLHLLGQSLNLLTMAGLLLSVGLGLDYAIIYFDRLDRFVENTTAADRPAATDSLPRPVAGASGSSSLEAAAAPGSASPAKTDAPGSFPPGARAAASVAFPLIGAVVTTLGAILPFLFVDGLIALLFRPLIITVAVAAVLTFGFAMILLPATQSGPSPGNPHANAPAARPSRFASLIRTTAAVFIFLFFATALAFAPRVLPFEVLPVVDDGFVEIRLTHPPGIATAELDDLSRRIESRFLEIPGTGAVFACVGGYFREGMPSFRPGTVNHMIRVRTGDGFDSIAWADAARTAVTGLGIPGIRLSITTPRIRNVEVRLADADVIVVLTRADGDLLALGDDERLASEIMSATPGLIDVERLRPGVSPRWQIQPDRNALAHHGISETALRAFVTNALEGRIIRQRIEGGEPLSLRLRHRRDIPGPERVLRARLPAPDNAFVHLADVANFALIEEPMNIERREQQRVVRVAATLAPSGPPPARVLANLENALAQAGWQPGTNWWTEGEIDALGESRRTFAIALGLALFFVFAWLVVQFRRASFALATLIVLPLAAGGAFWLLYFLGRPIDAMVLAGLLIAIGITANNAILVLDQATDPDAMPADTPLPQRLIAAGRQRLRPVVITTTSTVLGMSPLLLGGGGVSGMLQPLAIALTGALLASIPLSCLVLPALAGLFSRNRPS